MFAKITQTIRSWRAYIRRIREEGDLVALTAVTGMMLQVSRPLASLFTIPFLLAELGSAGLGVWMIALSLMGLIDTLNSGLSIILVTRVGRARDTSSSEETSILSASATTIALLTAAILAAVCTPLILLIDWASLFSLEGSTSGINVEAMLLALTGVMALGFIASVPRQIMFGRLHGFIPHCLEIVAIFVGALGLIVGLYLDQPLWCLALLFLAPSPLFVFIGGLVYMHRHKITYFAPSNVRRDVFESLGRDSVKMVGYHAAYSVSSQTDTFLIGALVGAQASAIYGVAHRIFSLPMMLALAISQAQWPALARADAEGDYKRFDAGIDAMLRNLVILGAIASTTLFIFYSDILTLWLGRDMNTDLALLVGQAIWIPVAIMANAYDISLRARDQSGYLAKRMMFMAMVNLSLSFALVNAVGYAGAIWGTVIAYVVMIVIPYRFRDQFLRSARVEVKAR